MLVNFEVVIDPPLKLKENIYSVRIVKNYSWPIAFALPGACVLVAIFLFPMQDNTLILNKIPWV
jgi:hypothetical protein